MTPNQRVFHKEYGAELIRLAEEDLKSARVLLRTQDVRPENGLFHVQQCVEKCLKAVLCHEEKAVPLTHEISVLLMALGNRVPPGGAGLSELTPFAAIRRYEEGIYDYSEEEKLAALKAAEATLLWAKGEVHGGKKK